MLEVLEVLEVFFCHVGSDVPGRRGGGCVGSCRGLFAFLPIICVLHVAVFGVSSYYMKKFKPGGVGADPVGRRGGWCSVFVEKTNKENTETCKNFYKKVLT